MKASARHLRISPKKANVIAYLVRGKHAQEASQFLDAVPKKGAKMFKKIIDSAIANAKNNDAEATDNLYLVSIYVTKASSFRRGVPASRGRVAPIVKRNSHVFVELGAQQEVGSKKQEEKNEDTSAPEKSKNTKPKAAKKKTVAKSVSDDKK